MHQIIIQGLKLEGKHGVTEDERSRGQPFEVDIEVECASSTAQTSDRLEDTVDYDRLIAIAERVIGGPPRNLLETLAAEIAASIVEIPGVSTAEVTVKKLSPPLPVRVSYTAARVRRSRSGEPRHAEEPEF